jgi:hypothetical protein
MMRITSGMKMGNQEATSGLTRYTKANRVNMTGTITALIEKYFASVRLNPSYNLFFGLLICFHMSRLKKPSRIILPV